MNRSPFLALVSLLLLAAVLAPPCPTTGAVIVFVLNLLTLLLFAVDKLLARLGQRRVPEAVLHGLTLAGGVTGAAVGRWLCRHKTRKAGFDGMALLGWLGLLALRLVLSQG